MNHFVSFFGILAICIMLSLPYFLAGTYSLARYYRNYQPSFYEAYETLKSQRGLDKLWTRWVTVFHPARLYANPESLKELETGIVGYFLLGLAAYIVFPLFAIAFLSQGHYIEFVYSILMSCIDIALIIAARNLPYRIFGHKMKRKNDDT